jgi:hypothetical protein
MVLREVERVLRNSIMPLNLSWLVNVCFSVFLEVIGGAWLSVDVDVLSDAVVG